MDFLNTLLYNTHIPFLTATILGLLTALSPCPLATNITAVGYISRNIDSRKTVFLQGLVYTLGRVMAYTTLGAMLIYIIRQGADTFSLQQVVSEWGERLLGPALILIGLFLLLGHLMYLPKFGYKGNIDGSRFKGTIGAFLLGLLFALAFCPTSGLLYFGMLIPMSAESAAGYLLPLVFAVSSSLPVLMVAWLIAFSMQNLSKFVGGMQTFQLWFNRVVSIVFIGVGIYYTISQLC